MTENLKKEMFDWVESIVFSVAFVVLLFTFVFRIVGVSGVSMANTLNPGVQVESQMRDRVLITDINYTPHRSDIVVISTKAVAQPIIKRVIAVGGDTVNIDFTQHVVSVNGKALKEPYIKEPTTLRGDMKFPLTVPKGHVFVMGDNRNDSYDSRFSAIGLVDNRNIIGHAILRIYPLSEIKRLA